jgi:hypothetical protein
MASNTWRWRKFSMNDPALKMLLDTLESSRSSLDSQLFVWTLLVVIGVTLEVVFVVWEYREELHDFQRGITHPPDKPSTWLLLFGLFGASLVAAGVSGELYMDARIGSVETAIRKANDDRASLLSGELGKANERASVNAKEAAQLRHEAALIEQSLAWRQLNGHDEYLLASRLGVFKQETFSLSYIISDVEGGRFAWEIAGALHKARLNVLSPGSFADAAEFGRPFDLSLAVFETGVNVASTNDLPSRHAADTVVKALQDCGFNAARNLTINKGSNLVWIEVRARPQGPQGAAKLRLQSAKQMNTAE